MPQKVEPPKMTANSIPKEIKEQIINEFMANQKSEIAKKLQ